MSIKCLAGTGKCLEGLPQGFTQNLEVQHAPQVAPPQITQPMPEVLP